MPPAYGFQGNLVPGWSWESPAAGPPNANWTEWVETENSVGGVATVEADNTIRRFGVYSLQLSITAATDSAYVTSTNYIPINNALHYVLRFSHYKVSGANSLDVVIKQYSAVPADLGDDIVITPTGAAAWGISQTVIHAAGDGGNDWNANCTQVKFIIRVDTAVANWRVDGLSLAPHEDGMLSAFGSQVFIDGYAIGELTGINFSASGDVIDVSSHDSANMFREKAAGMRDGGSVAIEGNLDLSDAGQVDYEGHYEDGAEQTFHIVFPFAAAEFVIQGIPNGFEISAPYDDKLSWSGEIAVDGMPWFGEATY
jgi:predicted secreted protein